MKKLAGVLFLLFMFPMVMKATTDVKGGPELQSPETGRIPSGVDVPVIYSTVLFSQIPDTLSGQGYSCQRDTAYPFESELAEDFILPTGEWIVDSVITWFVNWNGFNSWSLVKDVRVSFYADSGGIPADSSFYMVICDSNYWTAYPQPGDSNRARLEIELPTPITLLGERPCWISIQPSNVYSENGQTGMNGGALNGNGQETYFRSAYFSYPDWTPASTVWGDSVEIGLVLLGSPTGIEENIDESSVSLGFADKMPVTVSDFASITYTTYKRGSVTLRVFDISGHLVKNLVNNQAGPVGTKTVIWNLTDEQNRPVPNGVYFLRLESNSEVATSKLTVLK